MIKSISLVAVLMLCTGCFISTTTNHHYADPLLDDGQAIMMRIKKPDDPVDNIVQEAHTG